MTGIATRLAAAVVVAIALVGTTSPPAAATDPPDTVTATRADRRVYMVTDSVGLGAAAALPAAFGPGWSVTVDGTPALFVEMMEQRHVRNRMVNSPQVFGDVAVVAGGYNYPYWDPARFDRSIDSMIATLRSAGVRHVLWVTLREVDPRYISAAAWRQVQPYYWYFPTVNQHLERALARHPELSLVDWAAAANRTGVTYDAIHLNQTGAALYSSLIRDQVRAVTSRAAAGSITRIPVPEAAGTAAVAITLTATSARSNGYLTAFACGVSMPVVSNANFSRDQTVAATAVVPVGATGEICVFTSEATNLIVDITGRFPTGGGLVPVTPRRLSDTRRSTPGVVHPAGVPLRVKVAGIPGVAPDARAVALTVTAVGSARNGFVNLTPCGRRATDTSMLNFVPARATPNLVIVEPGVGGEVCLTTSSPTELVVDLFGSFTAGADLRTVEAVRALDSRSAGRRAAGSTTIVDLARFGPVTGGVMVNLTATDSQGTGFVTAYPCGAQRPTASNLNTRPDRTVANYVLVSPDARGRICLFTSVDTHLLVDFGGSTGTTFTGVELQRLLDTRS